MDVDYGKNLDEKEQFVSEFKQSLYVLSTVQSVVSASFFNFIIQLFAFETCQLLNYSSYECMSCLILEC